MYRSLVFSFLAILLSDAKAAVRFVDMNAATGGNGTSWATAFQTIQAAVSTADAGDEIWVAKGVYQPALLPSPSPILIDKGMDIYGGFSGTETTRTERDSNPDTNNTIISGKAGLVDDITDNLLELVRTNYTDPTQSGTIDGFTFERAYGAALNLFRTNEQAIRNCRIRLCSENSLRFPVDIFSSATGVHFENCSFVGNYRPFQSAENGWGKVTLKNCLFQGNTGLEGGAISMSSPLQLSHCRFLGNNATNPNSGGGAIHIVDTSLTATNCVFAGNRTNGEGGALHFEQGFTGKIISSVFSGNRSTKNGSAIAFKTDSSPVIANCTFASNYTEGQFTIHTRERSRPRFYNCAVWGNGSIGINSSLSTNSTAFFFNCLVENHSPSLFLSPSKDNLDGTNPVNEPRFLFSPSPLSAPTVSGDYRIKPASPLLEEGSVAFDDCGAFAGTDEVELPALDLAGSSRITGIIDIGAHEGTASPLTTFDDFFPNLDPSGDFNDNRISNFAEYAAGFDPRGKEPFTGVSVGLDRYSFTRSMDATDTSIQISVSTDLTNWSQLTEGVDYPSSPASTQNARATYEVPFSNLPASGIGFLQAAYSESIPD